LSNGVADNESVLVSLSFATALVFLAIYAIKTVIMIIPAPALYIAAGVTFPTMWAIIITLLGLFINLSLGYFIGKKLGENRAKKLLAKNKKVAAFFENQKESLTSLCFISRVTPLPKDLPSMFFGAVGMPFPKYMVVSLLGISPVMIPYIFAASSISTPLSPEFLVPFGISLSITLIIFFVFNKKTAKTAT
jgi:uncharacterized membrane protein YdjX (TVP38/TMEM64 family)